MQKRNLMFGGGTILLMAAGAALWWGGGSGAARGEKAGTAPISHERPRPKVDGTTAKQERGATEAPAEDPAVQAKREEEKKAALAAIGEASTTYEAAQLPFINKYLYDKDPEIRKAAREGMLVLGDAAAGKYLRDASLSAATEEERQALVNAADYAELPPVDMKALREQQRQREANGEAPRKPRVIRDRGVGKERPADQPKVDVPAPTPIPPPAPAPAPQSGSSGFSSGGGGAPQVLEFQKQPLPDLPPQNRPRRQSGQ